MLIYRFRIKNDDQEDFLREIEIQPNQTFLDFHDIILSSADLESCDKTFFYTTDLKYNKKLEISLKPVKKQLRKYDEELDEIITEIRVPHLMKDSRLKNFIEDPHQKMIFEYHGKDIFIFYIELFKIIQVEGNNNFPRCVKMIGELPRKVEIPMAPVMAPPEEDTPLRPLSISPNDSLFDGIHENEAELAEIENHLEDYLKEKQPVDILKEPVTLDMEEEEYAPEEEEHMESLDEYEDLEKLEIRHRNFGGESDE